MKTRAYPPMRLRLLSLALLALACADAGAQGFSAQTGSQTQKPLAKPQNPGLPPYYGSSDTDPLGHLVSGAENIDRKSQCAARRKRLADTSAPSAITITPSDPNARHYGTNDRPQQDEDRDYIAKNCTPNGY